MRSTKVSERGTGNSRGGTLAQLIIGAIFGGCIGAGIGVFASQLKAGQWDAAGAIATAAATIVALWSSWNAIRMPERQRERDRREATREVLRATRMAIVIFRVAYRVYPGEFWQSARVRRIKSKAAHTQAVLARLIQKPELTDGAISAGLGAMQILTEVDEASAVFFEKDGMDFGGRAEKRLRPIWPLVSQVRLRYRKVRDYNLRKRKGS